MKKFRFLAMTGKFLDKITRPASNRFWLVLFFAARPRSASLLWMPIGPYGCLCICLFVCLFVCNTPKRFFLFIPMMPIDSVDVPDQRTVVSFFGIFQTGPTSDEQQGVKV